MTEAQFMANVLIIIFGVLCASVPSMRSPCGRWERVGWYIAAAALAGAPLFRLYLFAVLA